MGIGVAILAIAVPLVVSGNRRKNDGAQHQAERADDAAEWAVRAEAASRSALEAAHPRFTAEAHPIAQGTVLRDEGRSPVELSVQGDSVWVHGMALEWRYSADADWRGPAGACTPLRGVTLPAQLTQGRAMGFTWSADQPPKVGQLAWELHVTWGRGASGPTMVTQMAGGSTNWQNE